MNKFFGILNASPEKRYINFISTITDLGEVWLFSNNTGYLTIDDESYINLLVWPTKDFALYYNTNKQILLFV